MMWIALYSQTGSEIDNIISELGLRPNLILTNTTTCDTIDHAIRMKHSQIQSLLQAMPLYDAKNYLVTLHGYLNIVPPATIDRFPNMYNGHPGLINLYPELRGRDPQKKIWDRYCAGDPYQKIGSVIHRVTPEVDEGPIQLTVSTEEIQEWESYEDALNTIKKLSLISWTDFLGFQGIGDSNGTIS